MATTTDYGRCTEHAPREPGSHWITRPARCPRPATAEDGLCGPHRAGEKRRKASEARWEARRMQERREEAQAAYVTRWRAEHPDWVWPDGWTCPICNRHIQESEAGWLGRVVRDHHREHYADWDAYQRLGQGE